MVALTGVCCALLAGCGGSSGPSSPPPPKFYGITPGTPLTTSDLARMKRAGVGSLRVRIFRSGVQPTRHGGYNWTPIDQLVGEAASQRIDVLGTVSSTPPFERRGCEKPSCASEIKLDTASQRAGWRRFFTAAVRRYGPGGSFWQERPDLPVNPIRRWQIWNEQNSPIYKDPPETYTALLRIAHSAITGVDPKAQIILGGMFGTPMGGAKTTAWHYLSALYAAGAGKSFDAVALHPYSPNLAGISYQLDNIRRVLTDHGDASKPTYITEIGWGSGAGTRAPGTGARGQVFVVSRQRQAENLTRSFDLLTHNRETWKIGGVYWFSWKDPANPSPGLCAFCYSAGLYRANGKTAKPALAAYERFTKATHKR